MLAGSELNDGRIEVRAVYRNQQHGILVRMMDKESRWGYDNGLKTMIPSLLFQGILGYPYVLPDMIGGNNYGSVSASPELFIRWAALTTFMPTMQFSIAPWSFTDPIAIELSKKFVDLHAGWVFDRLMEIIGDDPGAIASVSFEENAKQRFLSV